MGSGASKAARKGPPRKYPTRATGASPAQTARRPPADRPAVGAASSDLPKASSLPSQTRPREVESSVETDVEDADFAGRLRQMGIVRPHPTFSPSSTAPDDADLLRQIQKHQKQYASGIPSGASSSFSSASPGARQNTTLSVLDARRRIQDQATADEEGRSKGREFLTALTIRDILVLRERGVDAAAIEARLQLKPGVVARLGPRGLVEALNVAAPAAAGAAAAAEKPRAGR